MESGECFVERQRIFHTASLSQPRERFPLTSAITSLEFRYQNCSEEMLRSYSGIFVRGSVVPVAEGNICDFHPHLIGVSHL